VNFGKSCRLHRPAPGRQKTLATDRAPPQSMVKKTCAFCQRLEVLQSDPASPLIGLAPECFLENEDHTTGRLHALATLEIVLTHRYLIENIKTDNDGCS
jgi:hypothetical protein